MAGQTNSVEVPLQRLEQVSNEANLEYPIWYYIYSENYEVAKQKTRETLSILPNFLLLKILSMKSKEEIIVMLGLLEYYNFLKKEGTKYKAIPENELSNYWEMYLAEVRRLSGTPLKNETRSHYVQAMEKAQLNDDHDPFASQKKLQDLLGGLRGLYLVLMIARIILNLDLYQVFKYLRDDMRNLASTLPKIPEEKEKVGWYEVFGPDGKKKVLLNYEAVLVGSHIKLRNNERSGLCLHNFASYGVSRINCAIIYLPDRGEEDSYGTIVVLDFGSYQGLTLVTEDGQMYKSTPNNRQIIMVPAGPIKIGIGNNHAVTLTVKPLELSV